MKSKIKVIKKFEPLFKGDLSNYRRIIYYGGRGGGKTEQIAKYILFILMLRKSNQKIIVLRKNYKDNNDSAKSIFLEFIRETGLNDFFISENDKLFHTKSTKIICKLTNSEITFSGLSNATIDTIKSKFRITLAWIDEAHYLTKDLWNTFTKSIRGDDSQILLTLNPKESDGFIYQKYIKDYDNTNKNTYVCKVNYYDNYFFPKVLELERQEDERELPRDLYLHLWEGEPTDFNDMQVIEIEKIGRFDDKDYHNYKEIFIVVDTAFSVKTSADYSVIGVFGIFENDLHLLRIMRGQWDFSQLIDNFKNAYNYCNFNFSNVEKILIENKASGQSLIQELTRITNLNITPLTPKIDKFARLCEVLPYLKNLKLPLSGDAVNIWIKDFLKECKDFRADLKHKHDDQVDVLIYALQYAFITLSSVPDWSSFNDILDSYDY